ncbi:hypothetical protein NL676_026049 [Syzygium grande]|nr:hypothetical protein NL676_026049 [Syzygium grande]
MRTRAHPSANDALVKKWAFLFHVRGNRGAPVIAASVERRRTCFGVMGLHIYSHEDEKISSADMRRLKEARATEEWMCGWARRALRACKYVSTGRQLYFERPYQ